MKLSKAQQNELEVWKYFMSKELRGVPESEEDIKMFFEWSEIGLHKDFFTYGEEIKEHKYFYALMQGKKWAGIHMHEMYEEGVLDGSMPYFLLLGGDSELVKRKWWQFWKPQFSLKANPIPRLVVDFMKKEMFKGMDAEVIENCYQEILIENKV